MTTTRMKVWKRLLPVFLVLLTCTVSVPGVTGYESGSKALPATQAIDDIIANRSLANGTALPEHVAEPTPVDLFHFELDQATLPGPRYMAFGPSVIGISADPRVLAGCFAVALIALVIWFVSFRNRKNNKDDSDRHE